MEVIVSLTTTTIIIGVVVCFCYLIKQKQDEVKRQAAKVAREQREREREWEEAKAAREHLFEGVDRYRANLARNLERKVRKNDYGAVVSDKRNEELLEFFRSIALDMTAISFEEAKAHTLQRLKTWEDKDKEKGFNPDNLPPDGHEFEHWVSESLKTFGWSAKVTSASGDQGIDVIATMKGKKLGLQCKRLTKSNNPGISNKAVQEAHAGKTFYGLDEVGVLSNASYTSSAKELARASGVRLLSHHDIPTLYEKVFVPSQ